MSKKFVKAQNSQDSNNSRVQKITEKFETLITSQQQQVHPQQHQHPSVQISQLKGPNFDRDSQKFDHTTVEVRDLDARRGIKRSQAFRRSTSKTGSINGVTATTTSNQQLIHTDSIREALNKPLPVGPPPEKPPRTWKRETSDGAGFAVDVDRVTESQHYEEVNMLIEAAFQEPEKRAHESPSREQISLKRPVSEEHRKRLRRLSRCAELNHYTQQYGTIRVYDIPDKADTSGAVEYEATDTKGLIERYNRLSIVEAKPRSVGLQTLFEYCIVVGYDMMQNKAYIKSKYPTKKQLHKLIEVFVYPDNGALVRNVNQQYCIILTDYPQRLYGFCRRVLPESSEFCIPLTYCLVTKYNEPKVFYKLLECIESQHGNGRVPELLMEQFYEQKLPLAGEKLVLTLPVSFEIRPIPQEAELLPIIMTINRPKDLRLEKTELYDLFKCLGSDGLMHVFECLLLEKMVILFSEHISLLTSCVQGLLLILYPFQWQHILVTIIPDHLQQMLEAPVPMLAGTLQPVPEELWVDGNACYVNLDRRLVRPVTKEQYSILPSELKKPLSVSLELVKIFEDSQELASVLIGGAFVRFFVELFSNLDPSTYQKSSFLELFENPEVKLFLNCFLETVMFADFLEQWPSSKDVGNTRTSLGSFDYTLFNSKIAEKSQNKYWHTVTFDEVVANSKQIERKGKTFMSKVKSLMKKS
ncbi:DENN domain-containing protein 2B-like [Anopheles nili]|uniref:DENN domain-containing protein 2B-like n=1 Tax=Anopheles nili TaxID=185578 RepID=UPI00237B2BC2|nr:DENN domain-containing protein 2B-like [Anopheles nili]